MSYLLLDLVFLAAAAGLAGLLSARRRGARPGARRRSLAWVPPLVAGVALLALTAVFDNVMIAVGLFSYASAALSGLAVGLAPLEDFAYPLAAAALLPALWVRLSRAERTGGTTPAGRPGRSGRRDHARRLAETPEGRR
ncbi:lycopene cyclase domain-containing protein [Sinomonas atrocyanea]|uniref:lycopene cyclase domain-containing protein n=1 Tax=Sinomonas atrocyanea TaxID=37927 RepID=UPI003D966A5D